MSGTPPPALADPIAAGVAGGWRVIDATRLERDGELLSGGYISLQSESGPLDVRKIELLDLTGCIDPKARNYRKYFVRSSPTSCK